MSSNDKIDINNQEPILTKLTVNEILRKKNEGRRIVMITAYDYCMSRICDYSDIDIILVGDSARHCHVRLQKHKKNNYGRDVGFLQGSK